MLRKQLLDEENCPSNSDSDSDRNLAILKMKEKEKKTSWIIFHLSIKSMNLKIWLSAMQLLEICLRARIKLAGGHVSMFDICQSVLRLNNPDAAKISQYGINLKISSGIV